MDARSLLALANLTKRDRYQADRAKLQTAKKEDWRWVGYDSTIGMGIVQSGNITRMGKVITNGYLVEGQPVEFNQDGQFGTIEGMPYIKPQPRVKKAYIPKPDLKLYAWAIARNTFGSYFLVNLLDGETYNMGFPPATIPPCVAQPPGSPQPVLPSDPIVPNAPWYAHIWNLGVGWPTPPGPRCSGLPPVPPNVVVSQGGFNNTLRTPDGRVWRYFSNTYLVTHVGSDPIGSTFIAVASRSLITYSQSPTPPVIPSGDGIFAVISTGLVFSGWTGSYLSAGGTTAGGPDPWLYVSGDCGAVAAQPPTAPIDSRNPSGTPIPNTIETSLSIDLNGNPIALLRHTPNCVSPGVWNSEVSTTVVDGVQGTTPGRLSTDWRYGPTFTCRGTFLSDKFANFDVTGDSRTTLWSIEPADRPATLTAFAAAVNVNITEKTVDPSCSTTSSAAEIDIAEAIVKGTQFGDYTILDIAILIT